MDKRPPLGPQARKNLSIFGALTLLKALSMIVFAAVLATALTFMARMTYFALVAPQEYANDRAEQLAEFAGSGLATVDGVWMATLGREPSVSLLLMMGLIALVMRGVADAGLQYFAQKAAVEAKSTIRQQLVKRLLATGGVDSTEGTGATAVLLSRGLNALDQYYSKTLTALVSSAIIPFALWATVVLHDWVSGLVIACTIPLIPLFMVLIGKTTRQDTEAAQKELHRLSDHVVELVKGLPVLIGLGRERAQTKALKNLGENYQKATMFTLRSAFMSSFALELITTLSVAIVAVLIGVRLVKGELGLDTALLALILAPDCYLPLRQVGAAYHQSEDGVAALRQAQLMVEKPYPEVETHTQSDRISVRNLTVTYPGRPSALTNVYFSAKHGSTIAVVGDSGIGKSTLLGVLAGTLRDGLVPTGSHEPLQISGSVTGQGKTVYVPQNPVCIASTVEKEVALYRLGAQKTEELRASEILDDAVPLTPEETEFARTTLAKVGLEAWHSVHPSDLSAGQLRRLAIARAMATCSAILGQDETVTVLIDEPTAHLDAVSKHQVALALRALTSNGATTFIVTHDADVASSADAILEAHVNARLVTWTLTSQTPEHLTLKNGSITPDRLPASNNEPEVEDKHDSIYYAGFFQTLKTLGELTHLSGKNIALPVFLSVFTALAAISLTALSGWLIVRAAEQPAMMYLMVAIVGVRFFGIGRAASRYAERLATHRVMLGAAHALRLKTWINASESAPSIRQLLSGKGVLDRVVSDVDELRDAAPRVVLPLLTHLFVALAAVITTACVALPAFPIILMAIALSTVLVPFIVVRADQAAEKASREQTSKMLNLGVSALDAAPELSANGLTHTVQRAFASADARSNKALMRGSIASGIGQSMISMVWWFAALATIIVCWAPVREGDIKAPLVSIVVLMCTAMLETTDEYVEGVRNFRAFSFLTQRVRHQFPHSMGTVDAQYEIAIAEAAIEQPSDDDLAENLESNLASRGELLRKQTNGQPLTLKMRDAATRWPTMDHDVFTGFNMMASSGKWSGITGPSGSGKSTALAVLLGFLPLTEGELEVNGQVQDANLMRGFAAWCPQSSYIFESSIANNLAIARAGSDRPSDEEMLQVLDRVGLGHFVRSLEQGLDTPVGAGGSQVSGGQRQRIAVARTLLTESPLLLLDEPTAHLDSQAATDLMRDLTQATKGNDQNPAVVIVSHRPEDIENCNEVYALQ